VMSARAWHRGPAATASQLMEDTTSSVVQNRAVATLHVLVDHQLTRFVSQPGVTNWGAMPGTRSSLRSSCSTRIAFPLAPIPYIEIMAALLD
jgi:hypothetical protein